MICGIALCLSAILSSSTPNDTPDNRPIIEYVNPALYRVEHTARFDNRDVSRIKSLELNLPIPGDWPEQQISSLRVEGAGHFQLRNAEGPGRIARSFYHYLEDRQPPAAGESRSLSVSYMLQCKEIRTDKKRLEKMKFPAYAKDKRTYKYYTRSEKLIEADDPQIMAIADRISKHTEGPYRFAKAAYEFVLDHVEYTSPTPAWGAKACLKNGKGDCGQYAALFVAICRAGGIPARPVAGCWAAGTDQWHCWAEFQLPGVGWLPVGLTSGQRDEAKRDYYFCNLDNNRLAFVKAYNMAFHNVPAGTTSLGFLQVGCYYWYKLPGSQGSNMQVKFSVRGDRQE